MSSMYAVAGGNNGLCPRHGGQGPPAGPELSVAPVIMPAAGAAIGAVRREQRSTRENRSDDLPRERAGRRQDASLSCDPRDRAAGGGGWLRQRLAPRPSAVSHARWADPRGLGVLDDPGGAGRSDATGGDRHAGAV